MSLPIGEGAISLDLIINSKLSQKIKSVSEKMSQSIQSSINKKMKKVDPLSGMESASAKAGEKMGKKFADNYQKAASKINVSKFVKAGVSASDLGVRRDNAISSQENINAQIQSMQSKYDQLKYLNISGQPTEEMLKLEARILSLTDKSDRLTVDIRQLDKAIEEMNNPGTNQSLDKLKSSMDKVGNSSGKMKKAMRGANAPLINMRSIGRSLARNLLGLQLLITFAGQAMRKLASAIWGALTKNEEFNNSLQSIKGNLVSAFTPIGEAIMPMINSLMSALASATAKLAVFVNLLFGKTVKAAKDSAKAINATADAAKNVSAGFDQFNDITADSGSSSASGNFVDVDPAEVGRIQSFIQKIQDMFSALYNSGPVLMVRNLFTSIFNGFQEAFNKWFPIISESIMGVFNNIAQSLKPVFDWIIHVVEDALQMIQDFWDKYGQKYLDQAGEIFNGLIDTFNKIWTEIIDPIIKPALEMLSDLWEKHLKDILVQVFDFVGYAVTKIQEFYIKFVKPLVDWLVKILGPIFSNTFKMIFSIVGSVMGGLFDTIGKIIGNIRTIFNGFMTFLEGVFTGDWKKMWQGLVTIFKGIWDGIINIAKAPINFLIDALNGFINGLAKIKVPDWVPFLGGKSLSFPGFTGIPRLANGGVLTQPTLALAGEYSGARSNPEIVSPQKLMAETFREVLNDLISGLQGGNTGASDRIINLTVNVGGQQLLNTLIDLAKDYAKQTGKELILNV